MTTVTLKGSPVSISGKLPLKGTLAPDFTLPKPGAGTISLSSLMGKRVLLNIFPSINTPVCAASVRKFNQVAAGKPNTAVLAISKDHPSIMDNFCAVEGITNVDFLTAHHDEVFGSLYGINMLDGPMAGMFARSVVIVDENGVVVYTELVPEIAQEPDYETALASL